MGVIKSFIAAAPCITEVSFTAASGTLSQIRLILFNIFFFYMQNIHLLLCDLVLLLK